MLRAEMLLKAEPAQYDRGHDHRAYYRNIIEHSTRNNNNMNRFGGLGFGKCRNIITSFFIIFLLLYIRIYMQFGVGIKEL